MELPEKLNSAVDQLSRIPGVGKRTALRHALYLSRRGEDDLRLLASCILELIELKRCRHCHMLADGDLCPVCLSPERRAQGALCVVEDIVDCMAIEKSGQFKGRYHVLGGVLNPLIGVGPEQLALDKLANRVQQENVTEIILAINPSVEGDATCSYIKQILPKDIEVDRIGFGIPMGGHLEFLDSLTISKALENRKRL
ncbi:MAG: recombination mediator RecR [Pseudomonadota bacterium]